MAKSIWGRASADIPARPSYIMNDLRRNWLATCTAELLARTLIRSPIVRHDAPQSCRAAFTMVLEGWK